MPLTSQIPTPRHAPLIIFLISMLRFSSILNCPLEFLLVTRLLQSPTTVLVDISLPIRKHAQQLVRVKLPFVQVISGVYP